MTYKYNSMDVITRHVEKYKQTDRRTDGQTDRRASGWTYCIVCTIFCIELKHNYPNHEPYYELIICFHAK